MPDISGQLIKDSYSYILQVDTSTGYVYRVNGNVPVNPIFSSGLTVFSAFTFVDGNQQNGYVLTSDGNGNSRWASVSGTSVSSVTASTGLSGDTTTGAITLINTAPDKTVVITGGTNIQIISDYPNFGINFTGTTSSSGEYLPLSGGTVTGDTIFQSGLTANTISGGTIYGNGSNLTNVVNSITASTGLSGNSTTGTITIINTAPDQTVTISGGTGISTGGTYPNFSIVNTAPDQTVTITGGTNIEITGAYPDFGVNFTGTTSGEYLPLSGGTVTGDTIFEYGLTANTLTITGLTSSTDSNVVTIDDSGVLHTYPLSGLTGADGSNTRRFMWDGINSTVRNPGTFVNGGSDNLNFTDNYLHFSYDYDYYGNPVSTWFDIAQSWTDVNGGSKIILQLTKVGDNSIIGQYFGISYIQPIGVDVLVKLNGPIVATNYTLQVGEVYSFSWVLNGADGSGTVNSVTAGSGLSGDTTTGDITIINTAPDQTVVITGGTNIEVISNYPNFGINFTGTTSSSGDYLPLSGGTVTGGTIFQSGVTANTISQTQYIDFTTGTTNPSSVAGRLFFDTTQKALSYFDIDNNQVPIAMGQQLYTRVWNASGVQIDKGKVIAITGTSNNLPSAILARNVHTAGSDRPIGLAAENIPNGSEGLVLNNGILSGITLNGFSNGDTLYLSDTTPGGYVASTALLSFTARTNEIGYVLETGVTTGKIYVNINNEDSNLSLTDKERNILEGNVISTGVYEYTGMTSASTTTVNIAPIRGWIVKNTYEFATLPDVTNLYYTGGTGITITNISSADATYVLINSASTIYQQTTFPTPQQRRENIFLGKVVHPNRTSILSVNNTVDFDVSPMSALRDLWTPLKLINEGIVPSANGANLSINTSGGVLWGNGIGWVTNQLNPDSVTISGKSPASFFYRTQTGGTSGAVSVIDPTKYDVGGVITSVGNAGIDDATNQRIYMYPTGIINILYGQQRYNNLAAAIAGIQSETFITYPNASSTGILIGILSVRNDIVADGQPLTNTNYAKFTFVSKFGELLGGTGGISTTTLQQAYNNSATPEIVTNTTEGALSIQNGTGNADNITNLFEGKESSSGTTSFIRADGLISGSSVSAPTILAGSGSISSSAALEVSSTTQGFLPPRMTEAQRIAIISPATGLMVYQTDGDEGLYINKSFGWVQII
jgi:hypothetical protein